MFLFVFAGFLATFLAYLSNNDKKNQIIFFSFSVVAIILGLQDSIGIDYDGYKQAFLLIKKGQTLPLDLFAIGRESSQGVGFVEPGWWFLNRIISYFTDIFQFVSFIYAIFLCFGIYTLMKYLPRKSWWVVIFLFYFGPTYMLFAMSGLRQTTAMICYMIALPLLVEKKYVKSLVWLLVATTFHKTAFYMIPIFCIAVWCAEKITIKHTKTFIIVGLLLYIVMNMNILLFRDFITNLTLAVDFAEDSRYLRYVNDFEIDRKLISISDLIFYLPLLFCSLKLFPEINNPQQKAILFLVIIGTILLPVFSIGSIYRILLYFNFLGFISIGIIYANLKSIYQKLFVTIYVVFFIYRYIFTDFFQNPQFINYLDYHTILF